MKARTILSPRAQRDLGAIWDYTADRWGIDHAEFYVRQIGQAIEALAARRAIGRPCPDVRTGYHKYPSGSHVLFYRLIDEGVEIIRVLHERMDVGRHL